jgi:hypothetical protein
MDLIPFITGTYFSVNQTYIDHVICGTRPKEENLMSDIAYYIPIS